ncbi:hypothetical protein [Andreprevotia chitinilytica]|uniref:hypothetical protein n=1 Tax=Andreprevotia chitinilytica TaxID=396808 RepID=UPI0005578021|nr:hypothetical protein [Andreprevotia chitinilytica]
MKQVSLSYKELFAIVEAIQFKLSSCNEELKGQMDEDARSDLVNDSAFLGCLLTGLKEELAKWSE